MPSNRGCPPSHQRHRRSANVEEPDVIVLLGDYVNGLGGGTIARRASRSRNGSLRFSRCGRRLASTPSSEITIGGLARLPQIRRAFRKSGIVLLENGAIKLGRGRDHFWIAGIKDQLAQASRGAWDLEATLRHISDHAPVILLAHEPDIFRLRSCQRHADARGPHSRRPNLHPLCGPAGLLC